MQICKLLFLTKSSTTMCGIHENSGHSVILQIDSEEQLATKVHVRHVQCVLKASDRWDRIFFKFCFILRPKAVLVEHA